MLNYKLIIQPFKNSQLVKYNLKEGINLIGNDQSHDLCIANKQIQKMHCQLNVTDDEVELQVLEGSVYMKNEEGQWEILDKNAIISLDIQSSGEFTFRFGNTIYGKVVMQSMHKSTNPQNDQVQIITKMVETVQITMPSDSEQITHQTPQFNQILNEKEQKKQKTKQQKNTLDKYLNKNIATSTSKNKIIKTTTKTNQKKSKSFIKEFAKSNRKKQRDCKYNVAFSGFLADDEEVNYLLDQKEVFLNVDGVSFNILIMESPINLRTFKLLVGLGKGIQIVSREWIRDSIAEYSLLDPMKYEVIFDKEFIEKYKFRKSKQQDNLNQSKLRSSYPFDGIVINIPKNINYHIERDEIEYLVNLLGGTISEGAEGITLIPKYLKRIDDEKITKQSSIENLFLSVLNYQNCL